MVDSIEITFEIKDAEKIRRYYSIFINTMAAIARNFSAKIIKNTGTSLIYYFPKTSSPSPLSLTSDSSFTTNNNNIESAFKDVLECGITMIAASDIINAKLKEEGGLPSLYYRISADYGRVEVARSITSPSTDDLFGSTMNICAKINSMAPPNGMVIGGSMYYYITRRMTSSSSLFGDYDIERISEYPIGSFKHQYPVYSVAASKKNRRSKNNVLNQNKQIHKSKLLHAQIHKDDYVTAPTKYKYSKVVSGKGEEQKQEQEHSHNILLVDDEPDTLLTYKTFLLEAASGGGEDYNVDAFIESQKALQRFAQVNASYYDLVVMDIRMPSLNGLQLYYRIKAMNPNIKVLFVSALDAAEEMVSILPGVKLNDDVIIKKPVNQEQFLYKVKKALIQ